VSCPPDITDKIYKPLKWSYDSLSKSIKPCFLYCSLFPEGFSIAISELALCWQAEGLIDKKENYENSFNRVINLIENLKDSCLLEDGAREGTVKMHDIIRDVAIWIASSYEDGCNSLIRSGIGLSEMSVDELLSNSLKRVSFMNNIIKRLPDCVVGCSEASTLLLQGNPLDRVPEEFLQGFEALRVLNMGGTRIHSLPLSLFQLGELRALLLGGCSSLDELPRGLDELNRLEVLDLSATGIKELPRGMKKLSNLKQLNLSSTRYLETIQAGIISQLSCLEVLDMTRSKYCFSVKRDVQKKMACFDEELKCLERLLVLYIRLERIPCLSSEDFYWTSRLRRSQFFVGPQANSVPTRHDKRMTWSLSSLDLSSEREIGLMLSNADSLDFVNCSGLSDMVINSDGCFAGLKSLTIQSCKNRVGRGGYAANDDLLPNLEELYLRDLNYGESISEVLGHLGLGFLKLKLIQVEWCSEMEYLFSFAVPSLEAIKVRSCNKLGDLFSYVSVKDIPQDLGCLKLIEVESCSEIEYLLSCAAPSLEAIKVRNCNKLGKLFKYLSVEDIPPRPVAPRLRILHLEWLPELRTLCDDVEETWPLLEEVHVFKCDLVKKLPLTDENAKNIEEIKGTSRWWNALKWDAKTTESRLRPFFHPYPF
jgi:disease resistance protein RPS2